MKLIKAVFLSLAISFAAVSCTWGNRPHEGEYSEVVIYCALGFNNLSSFLQEDMDELCKGVLPGKEIDKAILAFVHNTASPSDYETPTEPILMRIYRDHGQAKIDTLVRYFTRTDSADGNLLNQMLLDIKDRFPSQSYGMVFSSHATGWIKPCYRTNTELSLGEASLLSAESQFDYPLTKSIGAAYNGSAKDPNITEIDAAEFARSIPMKMDYIIFDACLMGAVEIAYEFRNVCDKLIVSPTEILASGLYYQGMSWDLLSSSTPDLKHICKAYFDHYNSLSESATISLIDCSKTEAIAQACKTILHNHALGLSTIDKKNIQKYFYDSKRWFYDLRSLMVHAGASESELETLDKALSECVLYHAETPKFFNLELKECCGLSVYIPNYMWPILNSYYKDLSWNKATDALLTFGFE